jgi:hypothetical protein
MGSGDRQVGWGRNGNKNKRGRKVISERRMNCASKEAARGVITSCSESRSDGRKRSVRRMQSAKTIMMAGRGSRVERTIGRETKRSSGASDRKFCVERTAVERIGFKRNNRVESA